MCVCGAAGYFTFWVIISLIWGLVATVIATLLPLWEARASLISMGMHLIGKGGAAKSGDHPPLDDSAHANQTFKQGQLPASGVASPNDIKTLV